MLDDLVLPGNDENARRDHRAGDQRHVAPTPNPIVTTAMITTPATVGSLVDRGSERTRFPSVAAGAVRNLPLGHRVTSLLSNPAGVLINSMKEDRPARSGYSLFDLRR